VVRLIPAKQEVDRISGSGRVARRVKRASLGGEKFLPDFGTRVAAGSIRPRSLLTGIRSPSENELPPLPPRYIPPRNLPPISGRMTRDSVKPSDDRLARKGSLDQKRIDNAERGGDTLDAMYRVALWYKRWYKRRARRRRERFARDGSASPACERVGHRRCAENCGKLIERVARAEREEKRGEESRASRIFGEWRDLAGFACIFQISANVTRFERCRESNENRRRRLGRRFVAGHPLCAESAFVDPRRARSLLESNGRFPF